MFSPTERFKLLLVQGKSPLRDTVLAQLRGFNLSSTTSGEEAMPHVLSGAYHALLIHETLPFMNGLTLLTHSRNTLRSPIPIVLIFDREDPELIRFAREAGVSDYILKSEIEKTTLLPRFLHQVIARTHLEHRMLELKREVSEATLIDPLTQTYNRAHLEQAIALEVARARERNDELSLVMVDIDNFKNVNDSFGHPAGDFVLKETARIIKKHLSRRDVFCRYGGDEFLILFPDTPREEALEICSRFQEELAYHTFDTGKVHIRSTVSIGLIPLSDLHESNEDFLLSADSELYNAKRQGKNCISYN